jgi:hypothetical protein
MSKSPSKKKSKRPVSEKSKPRKRRRRVFIFGAGVSASCGIAVAKDILREAIVRLGQKDTQKAERVHKLLKYLYPGFQKPALNYPNVEDFRL